MKIVPNVKNPLIFFAFSLTLIESIILGVILRANFSEKYQFYSILIMFFIFLTVILAVTVITLTRPRHLYEYTSRISSLVDKTIFIEKIKSAFSNNEIVKSDELAKLTGIPIDLIEQFIDSNPKSFEIIKSPNSDHVSYRLNERELRSLIDSRESLGDAFLKSSKMLEVEPLVFEQEIKGFLINELFKLPDKEKDILWLYYYEQLTFKQIAEKLMLSLENVGQLHMTAIRKLRKKITDKFQI